MSILKITENDIENFSVITNPVRSYVSSSAGVTGSLYTYARRSLREKDVNSTSAYVDSIYADDELEKLLKQAQLNGATARYYSSSDESLREEYDQKFHGSLTHLLNKIDSKPASQRKQKVLDIHRITPSVTFSSNTMKKLVIKDILNSYHRVSYPSAHWAYTNYNSLNFFTASSVPNSSVLLYPNIAGPENYDRANHISGTYCLSGAFSFDFYVNPRYQQHKPDCHFRPGTLFHLSSSYALSLVTGSSRDHNGKSQGYRLQLQLSHSADILPSLAASGVYPSDLTFLSDDNCLSWNRWHHVIVRWGTSTVNDGTGSFNIDGVDKGYFVVPSGTISPLAYDVDQHQPGMLCIGNYWEGRNNSSSNQQMFFSYDSSTREGLEVLDESTGVNQPVSYAFTHPLNAELHDLSIKRYYMTDVDIRQSSSAGPKSIDDSFALYVPPFFTEESPFRQAVNGIGGVLQTPFFEIDGSTNDPFNVAMSFGVNGHYINVENHVRDFANNSYPRLHHMSASAIDYSTEARTANEFLYENPYVRRRNLLILPCDDGNFIPSYELLASESSRGTFIGDDNIEDLSLVHLDNMLSTSSLIFGSTFEDIDGVSATSSQEFLDLQIGFSPEYPGKDPGPAYNSFVSIVSGTITDGIYDPGIQDAAPLTIYQRTKDPSSNQVTIFDVSNLFYGNRILPGSVVLTDSNLSGSNDSISITLKDDGWGNLYRADCLTSASSWNSCGNVYYDEGLLLIKNPYLFFFGKEQFELSFKGERGVHVLRFDVIAKQNTLNSSSNPTYKQLPASGYPNDLDPYYVNVTGINFHDAGYNIVLKTQMAQPIVKRFADRLLFRVGVDF